MDKVEEADKSKSSRYALCSVLRMTWSGFNGGLLEALQPKNALPCNQDVSKRSFRPGPWKAPAVRQATRAHLDVHFVQVL